jgi:hypothetical protein
MARTEVFTRSLASERASFVKMTEVLTTVLVANEEGGDLVELIQLAGIARSVAP